MIRKSLITMALASFLIVTVSSADQNQTNTTAVTAQASQNSNDVYGTVNGEKITKEEVNQILGMQGIPFDSLNKDMQKKIINMLVDRKLLAQKAIKSGVENSEAFKEKLKVVKEDLALNVWMDEETKRIEKSITDDEIKAYYEKNKDKFKSPAQLKASHILVKTEDEAKAIIKQLENAKDIKAEFVKLAKEKSIGPSGAMGGDLGWFTMDRMVPEFSNAANNLKKGEFTKTPVKTQFGYHIIYLEDKKPASVESFDKVKDEIKATLTKDKVNKLMDKTVSELRKDAKIDIKI
jgi:parvulin-like peptidyl-prolyl isomerase